MFFSYNGIEFPNPDLVEYRKSPVLVKDEADGTWNINYLIKVYSHFTREHLIKLAVLFEVDSTDLDALAKHLRNQITKPRKRLIFHIGNREMLPQHPCKIGPFPWRTEIEKVGDSLLVRYTVEVIY